MPLTEQFIVAIGASAGGLEAIHSLCDHLTDTAQFSFVIIQHLSPDHKSLLVELVARHTHMRVEEAKQDTALQPNTIYIIPPKKWMMINAGKLQLIEKKKEDRGPNTAIDIFLQSLAADQAERAIAIILSGTGTDGTEGAKAIKEAGGLVMVQTPESAAFDGMPRSAIAAGVADIILAPQQMPAELLNQAQHIELGVFPNGPIREQLLEEIFSLIFKHTGCDFHYYKLPTLIRRISRRMMHIGTPSIEDYVAYMREHTEEAKALCQDFLIGVTRFFRDTDAYKVLEQTIIPQIIRNKSDEDDSVKVWVCACSTGEEAYSIGMLVNECLEKMGKSLIVKIFATDIDGQAIETAARAQYPLSIANDVPEALLQKYFYKQGKHYFVVPNLRKQIVFARHNVIKDPPFIKNDMVTCRNMLIYLNAGLQKKVLESLHYSINENGYLFLGNSETIAALKRSMGEVDRKWKIYKRLKSEMPARLPGGLSHEFPALYANAYKPEQMQGGKYGRGGLGEMVREVLFEDMGFAAVYIDRTYEIKEALGSFRKYLALPEANLSLNLLRMLPTELGAAIGHAIRTSWKEGNTVYLPRLRMKGNSDASQYVNVFIKPGTDSQSYTLIIFGQSDELPALQQRDAVMPLVDDADANRYIAELKGELKEARLNLQMAVESLETSNEELQSSNEELLSSNEELQSSNEELQSLNEELHTLNAEHQLKIGELAELNDDLNNYFRSADVGQIFLDKELRVRKFNPAAVKLINLIETDIGRPVSNMTANMKYEHLHTDIKGVLQSHKAIERELTLYDGRTTLMRITPYTRADKRPDGVVLTFVDVTIVRELNNLITGVFNASQNGIMALKAVRNAQGAIVDFTWISANNAALNFYNCDWETLKGSSLRKMHGAGEERLLFSKYTDAMHRQAQVQFEFAKTNDGDEKWYEIAAVSMVDGVAVTLTDVSERHYADHMLRTNYQELLKTREELKHLNTELEEKINQRTQELSISEERFRLVSRATNDAVWDWDLVTNNIWLSDTYFSIFGYDDSQRYSRKDWMDRVHPDDKIRISLSLSKAVNSSSKQWSEEYRYRRANGEYAYILDRGYIMHDEFGTPYRMLSSMMDVTQLRQAQAAIESNIEQRVFLAESMPLIVWTATAVGRVNFLNKQFASYTGISEREGNGNGWESAIEPDDLRQLKHLWRESIRTKQDFSIEIRMRRNDGDYRWHLLRARARRNEHGRVIMWVGTNTDIHEQKLATKIMEQTVADRTRELQDLNSQLELSNHDLQQFASVASHDLKEPLRKIQMFSQMIRDRKLTGENAAAADYLERIIASSSRMTRLINDLLSFSRLSSDKQFEPVNINSMLDEVLSDLELLIADKHATVTIDDFPVIEGSSGQLRQVFQNIIGNALKFTSLEVKPEVRITCERVAELKFASAKSDDGDYLRIKISDNGIGFDEQYLDRIFTIFQRLHTREDFEGTGIGLAIVKKIIDRHRGIITAQSKQGEGSTFIIVLPVGQQQLSS